MPPKGSKIVKKKNGGYTVEKIKEAIAALNDGMSLRAASKRFGVPRTTLLCKRKGKTPLECKKGPETVLKVEQENELVEWIQRFSELGFIATKNQIFDSVQILLNDSQAKSKFTNNRPGRHWYESFLKRHPDLLKNISQHSSISEIKNAGNLLERWHVKLKEFLISKGLNKCTSKQIFMIEETSFSYDIEEKKNFVIEETSFSNDMEEKKNFMIEETSSSSDIKEKKNFMVEETSFSSDIKEKKNIGKECVSALFAGNADGEILPPMVIFLNKTSSQAAQQNIPNDWLVHSCDKANITGDIFYKYVTGVFYPWLQKNNVSLPVTLYVNGHKSHFSLPLCKFCDNHDIEVVPFTAKISSKLQPLEYGFFHYLKSNWNETSKQWQNCKNTQLNEKNFISCLKECIASLDVVNNLQNAFRICGLYPLDYDLVDYKLILKHNASEKKVAHKNSKSPDQIDPENLSHFTFFEQNLDPEILSAFQELEFIGKWVGDVKHESLFYVWLQMKRLVYNQQGSEEIMDESDMDCLDFKEEVLSDCQLESLSEVTPQIIEEPKNFIFDSINCIQNSSENLWT